MTKTTNPISGAVITNDAASDEIKFSITYVYCSSAILSLETLPDRIKKKKEEQSANKNEIRLFPNPSQGTDVTVEFNNKRGDWQVEVFSVSGQLINRSLHYNSALAKIKFGRQLASGMYIFRATNMKSQEKFVERLIVK